MKEIELTWWGKKYMDAKIKSCEHSTANVGLKDLLIAICYFFYMLAMLPILIIAALGINLSGNRVKI